jgi:phage tail-like protein
MNLRNVLVPAAALGLAGLLLSAASAAGVQPDQTVRNYGFRVEIEGADAGFFKSVDGLSGEQEVIEFAPGEERTVHKLPGRVKWPNIVLKSGFQGADAFLDWIQESLEAQPALKDVALLELSKSGQTVRKWCLSECFPVSWKMGSIEADGNTILVEEVVLAHGPFEECSR